MGFKGLAHQRKFQNHQKYLKLKNKLFSLACWVFPRPHTQTCIQNLSHDKKNIKITFQPEIEMSSSSSSSSSAAAAGTATDVFEIGKYKTVIEKVESDAGGGTCRRKPSVVVGVGVPPPPKPLLIGMPVPVDGGGGEFPVVVLLHGYLLSNSFYSQLIHHVASHGFIVIAPQLYTTAGPDTSDEIKSTAAITNWLSHGLRDLLPSHVLPNLNKLALAGHSRGGKVAFSLALKKASTNLKFSALIGIDPVDGMDKGKQTPPPVLTYVPHSFDLEMATLVIGSGLGEVRKNLLFPPCAPNGVNHKDFYEECRSPACYFVVKDYGHVDMLDDDTKGVRGKVTYCLCKNGESREPMRRCVGGLLVAFMKAYLEGDFGHLMAIRDGLQIAPVEFQKVDFLV